MIFIDEHWTKENINLGLSVKTYISNLVLKFEKLFGLEFKTIKTPMAEDYHPELDDSPFRSRDDGDRNI